MKYAIIKIDDRAKSLERHNKKILERYQYVDDLEVFDGRVNNGWDVLNHRGVPLDRWKPYDGRPTPAMQTEYGFFVTHMNILDYIVAKDVDKLLVFEDDVVLKENFVEILTMAMDDLPHDFDFLSLYWPPNQNFFDETTDIGSKVIHRSTNQYANTQAILYSNSCAKKFLKAIYRVGMEYNSDCMMYRLAITGTLNGYSLNPSVGQILSHEYERFGSTIDPTNTRKVHS